MKTKCKHCGKTLVWKHDAWRDEDSELASVNTFCYLPANNIGGQLHATRVMTPFDTVPLVPPQGRWSTSKREIEAFDSYARKERMNMEMHPMFYTYLDPETVAARNAWRAAIAFMVELWEHNEEVTK
jgi:hypothetical protein